MKKSNSIILTEGKILPAILNLTWPMIGTSLLMMLYSFTDIWCVSRIGSNAVSAVGTGGFVLWFSVAGASIFRLGTQVKVSHALGRRDENSAKSYSLSGIHSAFLCGVIMLFIVLFFADDFINFFKFKDVTVILMCKAYLFPIALSMPFSFLNPVFTGLITASGRSRYPFFINLIGLCINIPLNFLLVFGLFNFPSMGVKGAAFSTMTSQVVMCICFVFVIKKLNIPFYDFKLCVWPDIKKSYEITKTGLPYGIQDMCFAAISVVIGRFVAFFGNSEIAAQKIGSQLEGLSWQTADGFSSALSVFVGQNYAAEKFDRVKKGYFVTLAFSCTIGLIACLIFCFAGDKLFSLFFKDDLEAVSAGKEYLFILGFSQIFMCIEITTAGFFNGKGDTVTPSVVGVVFTALRIPFAYALSKTKLAINGIWLTICVSSVIKGVFLVILLIKKKKLI